MALARAVAPQHAQRATAEHVGHAHGGARHERGVGKPYRIREAFAELVDPDRDAVRVDIKQIGDPVTVYVGKEDPPRLVATREGWRVLEPSPHTPAKQSFIRPIPNLARMDEHDVGQAVASHVREMYMRVCEKDVRKPLWIVQSVHDAGPRPARLTLAKEGDEGAVAGAKHIDDPVGVEVNLPGVRVRHTQIGCAVESLVIAKSLPAKQRPEAGASALGDDDVRDSVAVHVSE